MVFRWINGKTEPSARALAKVAPLLGIPEADLIARAYAQASEAPPDPVPPPVADAYEPAVIGELQRLAHLATHLPSADQGRLRATVLVLLDWAQGRLDADKDCPPPPPAFRSKRPAPSTREDAEASLHAIVASVNERQLREQSGAELAAARDRAAHGRD